MILLKNATYIHPDSFEISEGHMLIAEKWGGGFSFVTDETTADKIIDCKGKIVTQAFVNGHHHVYSALARGMNAPKKIPQNFSETLEYVWWTLDQCLDKDMIRLSALTTAMACAKHGCTFAIDHHASPNMLKGSLEIIAQAFDEVGVGHLLCYEITDRYGEAKTAESLEESDEYLNNRPGLVGMHASFTVNEDTLLKAIAIARKHNTGIHIHVAEDPIDEKLTREKYGFSVMERLRRAGALELNHNIFGHGIHLDDAERELVLNSNSWMAVNADSNLNNKVGFFTTKGLGDRIMLGTDGMHSDMIKSAQTAFFAGQNFDSVDMGDIYTRLRNAGKYIQGMEIAYGSNNLIVLDYDSPTPVTRNNFMGHFFFGLEGRHVLHTISNGKLIYSEGKILTIDEDVVLSESRQAALRLWEKMSE
ncbi:MAG: amidohydrolase [Bacteroidetes bacterium HGW-Bacteroidetes-6]|jgi:cytosine/adenosine deaminase-related metal-dependent hydrolase|nr:MAG: amidohydrolase [Bacteroidetes bacterium HGW-Bacteroidetes-6]